MKDHLVRATAEGVRVFAAITSQLVGDAARRHDCYPTATVAVIDDEAIKIFDLDLGDELMSLKF